MDPHEEIRRRLSAPPPPPEDIVRKFLRAVWFDSGGEVDAELDDLASSDDGRRYLRRGVEAIDALLADPPPPYRLVEIVSFDANVPLEVNTEEEAARWLRAFAAQARQRLEGAA